MLETQRFIEKNGFHKLSEDLHINVVRHPDLPLCSLKYSQLDSPRAHPVVMECRGLVLNTQTFEVVAKPFNRFFNVGEFTDKFKNFDWSDFDVVSKEDGSLIILYNYDEQWHVNTSGSFGLGQAPYYQGTWRDLFWNFAKLDVGQLDRNLTYLFELCTPYNEVVKMYEVPRVFLIGVVETATSAEYTEGDLDSLGDTLGVSRPKTYKVSSHDEVLGLARQLDDMSELHEGLVLRDSNGRWKLKTQSYVALHRLKDNGNIIHPKRLVDIVLTGETPEVKAVMPRIKTALDSVEDTLERLINDIWRHYYAYGPERSQKKFALKVKGHRMAWVLFKMRKDGIDPDMPELELKGMIRAFLLEKSDSVAKKLFDNVQFEFDLPEVKPEAL